MRFFLASSFVIVALVCLVGSPALAQNNPNINMDDYVPSVHALDPLAIATTRIQPGWTPTGGLWLTYRKNALTIAGETAEAQVVENQLVGEFYGALSLKGWASIGLDVPVFFVSNGDNPAGIADSLAQAQGASLGDIRLSAKVKFWDNGNKGFGMGLLQDVTFPSSTGENFTGEESLTSKTALIADYSKSGWNIALNIGYFARKNIPSFNPPVEDEFHIGAGLIAPIICDVLEGMVTTNTRTKATKPFDGQANMATNWLAGLRARPIDGIVLAAAGGMTYGAMPGNPAWQAMFNIGYEARPNSCDMDEDGVADRRDECPLKSGPLKTGGCPDRDGDGILDDQDRCPSAVGKPELEGCPDADGDSVADFKDLCPTVHGKPEFRGCPDRDGDGIQDKEDTCPDVAGLKEFEGCPDTDGDGVEDEIDECLETPGPMSTSGCPDGDKDRIPDKDDKCPEIWGTHQHKGCPPPAPKKIKVTRNKIVILDKVFFFYASDRIKYKSKGLLKDVATVLTDNPWIKKVRIEGHTDDLGKRDYNLKLSQERAEAVVKFMIKEGIEADRLEAAGFGPDKPVVENKDEDSRKQNRRVEFSIIDPE